MSQEQTGLVITEDNQRLILTSHSIDNTFDYCARKFEFLTMYDKRPARDSGYAADIGTALHEGVQAWLIARAEECSEKECTERAYMALMTFFPWDAELEQHFKLRSFPNTALMLYHIIRHTEWDQWELVKVKDKGWAIEVPFLVIHAHMGEFEIKNAPGVKAKLATQGKIDFILRHKITGKYRTWDLKTTANDPDLDRAEYTYSGQQIGYSNVMNAMLDAQPDDFSVFYMVAHFSSDELPKVEPVELKKTQDMVDDYWLGKIDRLVRMKAYAINGWFPRTNGGCHSWGRECAFFTICGSRDYSLINLWFEGINNIPQQGYDYWVTMEV